MHRAMSCDDAGDEILGRLAARDVHLPGFGLVAPGPQRIGEGLGEVAPGDNHVDACRRKVLIDRRPYSLSAARDDRNLVAHANPSAHDLIKIEDFTAR